MHRIGIASDPFRSYSVWPEAVDLLLRFSEPRSEKEVLRSVSEAGQASEARSTLGFLKEKGFLVRVNARRGSHSPPAAVEESDFSGFEIARQMKAYPDIEKREGDFLSLRDR